MRKTKATPQHLRQAIMRYYRCRKIMIRGDGDNATVYGWGDLYDPGNVGAETWRVLGPLRLVTLLTERGTP